MKFTGHVDEISLFHVAGWIADLDDLQREVTVVLLVNDREVAKATGSMHRGGLETIADGATGRYAFRFDLLSPLMPFREYAIAVRVRHEDYVLPPGPKIFRGIETARRNVRPLPLRPILVTTMGRSGSTLLMRLLLSHPRIVVADAKPFEVELLTYYAYALRTLTAAGDHKRSLSPDRITASENAFAIGFNPYLSPIYRINFRQPKLFDELVSGILPERLRQCFHESILEYYTSVAEDTQKAQPIYFAEKGLPEPLIREAARYMFGSVNEIVLVRDMRDAVASFMSYGTLDFDAAFQAAASSAKAIMRIAESSGDDVTFLRYEDLVERGAETLREVLTFLGLSAETGDLSQDKLFKSHATSSDPRASIGRWKKDITGERLKHFEPFAAYQDRFGYDALSSAAVTDLPALAVQKPGKSDSAPKTSLAAKADKPAATPKPASVQGDAKPAALPPAVDLPGLAESFESLGENCEFGLVQRRCGAEPLGLLRFASVPIEKLLRALDRRFEGLGDAGKLEIQLGAAGREYMVFDRTYEFLWHAWVNIDEAPAEKVLQRELRRIPFLVRKLIEDLTAGSKTFVYHPMGRTGLTQAERLSAALGEYGPGQLLWVQLADGDLAPGAVERVSPRLLRGAMDRFAPGENAHDLSFDCWVTLLRNAAGG